MVSKILRSKTIWFAMIVAILSVLQGFVFYVPIEPIYQAVVGVALAVIITVLRFATHGSLDDK
jgi:hypothetical protein